MMNIGVRSNMLDSLIGAALSVPERSEQEIWESMGIRIGDICDVINEEWSYYHHQLQHLF